MDITYRAFTRISQDCTAELVVQFNVKLAFPRDFSHNSVTTVYGIFSIRRPGVYFNSVSWTQRLSWTQRGPEACLSPLFMKQWFFFINFYRHKSFRYIYSLFYV